ncbi:MAG TPA: hypothetical protein VG206_03120 [Terriglobia bacterium]|nr:hypothetical protein [Terriglobia bacterium]
MTPKNLDHAALIQDRAAGMNQRQLAEKYACSTSTISYHLRLCMAGAPAETTPARTSELPELPETAAPELTHQQPDVTVIPEPQPQNGHATFDELEQLLAHHWNHLPIVERVRILLCKTQRES